MKIIAICGSKGSGKNLVSNIISNLLKDSKIVKQIAFADPIKDIIMNTFNLKTVNEYDTFKRSCVTLWNGKEVSGRDIVRSFGMKMRSYDSEQFVDGINDSIDKFVYYHPQDTENVVFVITDLRFKNELKWIKNKNIPIIKVKRDGVYYDGHASEREIDDIFCDFVIYNNGTIEELEKEVKKVLDKLF